MLQGVIKGVRKVSMGVWGGLKGVQGIIKVGTGMYQGKTERYQ